MLQIPVTFERPELYSADSTKTFQSIPIRIISTDEKPICFLPQKLTVIETGIKAKIPSGVIGEITSIPRIAKNLGLAVFESPSFIPSGHSETIKVLIFNQTTKNVTLQFGDEIANLNFVKNKTLPFKHVQIFD